MKQHHIHPQPEGTVSDTHYVYRFQGSTSISIVIILVVVLGFATIVSGLFRKPIPRSNVANSVFNPYSCCDSGDGAACIPNSSKTITFRTPSSDPTAAATIALGTTYQLIKTNISLVEKALHIDDSGQSAPDGEIFFNTSNWDGDADYLRTRAAGAPDCHYQTGYDFIGVFDEVNNKSVWCNSIKNDEIIYVCKSGAAACSKNVNNTSIFDAYYRVADGIPVPAAISSCVKPSLAPSGGAGKQIMDLPTPPKRYDLQLETFGVHQEPPNVQWLSPYCKPAIYLYPPSITAVNVQIAPKGKLTLTIPQYPLGGWNVLAYPGGRIESNNTFFDYLYYEAQLPDSLAKKPETGYSVEYSKLQTFLPELLTKLGLNETEQREFTDYWIKSLPQSPYYFVGVVSTKLLDELSPLSITPKPDTTLRVTLYFQAQEQNEAVTAPTFSGSTRSGFTAVEWGGIFKRDKTHTFSCFM